MMPTNMVFEISLSTALTDIPNLGDGSVFDVQSIDPHFAFAPGFDSTGFSCVFSDGIVNEVVTPLPAALPLFATGLGAVRLLGGRRKQTARSVAA